MVLSSELLASILDEVRPLLGQGKVADYIPALAQVPADRLGIAVCTVEGSCSPPVMPANLLHPEYLQALSLTLALTLYQEEEIWARVGKEPSGQPFNSLVQLEFEQGIPATPFINAGALVVSDLLETRLTAPRQRTLELVRRLGQPGHHGGSSGGPLRISALCPQRGHRLSDEGVWQFRERSGQGAAELLQCLCDPHELRRSGAGIHLSGQPRGAAGATTPLLPARTTKQVNALLATCGLYDEAGILPIGSACRANRGRWRHHRPDPGNCASVSGRLSSTRRATRWRARRRWNCWPSVWAAPF